MPSIFVTSRANDKKIAVLDSEIARIEAEIKTADRSIKMMTNRHHAKGNSGEGLINESCIGAARAKILNLRFEAERMRLRRHDLKQSTTRELSAYLRQVNGLAVKYTLDENRVVAFAHELEELFAECGTHVRNRFGTEVIYRPAGKSVRTAYSTLVSANITTRVALRRVQDGWRLISADRDRCYVNQKEYKKIIIGHAANDNIIRAATARFTVRDSEMDDWS